MRQLGMTGMEVSEIAFGAWQLGNSDDWVGMDDRTAHDLVNQALDGGINLFDTAPNYAGTNSERILGEVLEGKRNEVVLVSKFGHRPDGPKDFSVDLLLPSLEASLKRLRTDYLDVLLLHNPDAEMYEGADDLWDVLEKAKTQGKIRHYGASLDFAFEIESCLSNTGSEVLEVLFNIFHQDVRRAFPTVRERNAGVIVKIPLDSGWLTGRFDGNSRFHDIRSRWTEEEISERASLVSQLDWLTVGGESLASRALAYALSYDEVSCVIPGISNSSQLADNLAASGRRVTPAERERLEGFWSQFTSDGANLLPW
jgi:aryl-alcohol dehydrogenase-like predicted oxidoreductase